MITKTAGDGVTTSVYSKNELIPVNSNSTLYHFTGITEFDARESIDKVVVGNAVYEKSAAQEIIDNRLVRANLTEQTIDYSNFQRHANTYSVDLKVEKRSWKIKDFNVANSFISKSDSRYPTNYETGISNEVYALGVVFRFKQGFLSPVFHIPGRAKTESEQGVVTINTFNYEFTGHLGELGETIPVWKTQQYIYNEDNENNLAFYECVDSFYPTTKDCDGQYIFGELAGTNIRHHRMPHRGSELPLYDIENDVVNFMGFDIQKNEDYPHPDIIDHFYVRGVPGTTDFIVEDAGYIGTKVDSNRLESYLQFAPLLTENYYGGDLLSYRIDDEQLKNRMYGCITNRVMAGIPPAADYLNIDSVVRLSGDGSPKIDPETTGNEAQGEYELESAFYFFDVFEPVLFTSTKIDTAIYATRKNTFFFPEDANVFYDEFNTDLVVGNELNDLYVVQTEKEILTPSNLDLLFNPPFFFYVYFMNNRDVYSNLTSLTYQRLETGMELGGYISTFSYSYSRVEDYKVKNTVPKRGVGSLLTFFSESRTNPGVRQSDFSPIYYSPAKWSEVKDKFNNSIFDAYFKDGEPYSQALPEYWNFNPDYSDDNRRQYHYPLPLTYDYCSKCYGEFPNRVVYSGISFGEEVYDGFRVFLNEDYVHIGNTPISNLRYANGIMYVHTEKSMFFLQPNPRLVQTNADNVYIGTGEFLSIPPAEIARTTHGHAGCKGRHHLVGTEMGWFFVDQSKGKVFLANGQSIEELSSIKYGMSQWFKHNLPSKLVEQIPYYPHQDSPYYIGLIAGYEPINNRYFLHKRDYEIINYGGTLESTEYYLDGYVYYNTANNKFYIKRGFRVIEIELGDSRYFANRSWTISFSLDTVAWESFHGFMPNHMQYDSLHLYSSIDNTLWKHVGPISSYYNKSIPFVVEFIINNPTAALLERVLWYSRTEDGLNVLDFPTFDKLVVYTEMQSTGHLTLVPPASNRYSQPWNTSEKTVQKFRDLYTVSGFRNMSYSNQVITTDWEYLKDVFPLDKAFIGIDPVKSQYNQEPIRGKAIRVRFMYHNNKKLIFNVSLAQDKNSLR